MATRGGVGIPSELILRISPSILETTVSLEDDLIVGTRVTFDKASLGATGKALRDCLLMTEAQPLDVQAWHNAREPIAVEKQPGQVVLMVFWSSKNTRSVSQLARVEALQRKGKKVTVASTLRTQPPMIADDLRRQADHFLELFTLADTLGRDPAQRPQRPARANEFEDQDEDAYEDM